MAWRLLLGNAFFAIIWMPLRFFVGRRGDSADRQNTVNGRLIMDGEQESSPRPLA
jgi:hypothetical protein